MKRFHLTLLLFAICLSTHAQEKNVVKWLSFEQLADSLAVKPKKVMLFFHTSWCSYCTKMQNSVFTNVEVIEKINDEYYAVSFDAESMDSIYFEGQLLKNEAPKKRTGRYHDITKLLAPKRGEFVFPTTIILAPDFTVQNRYFTYLSATKILKALAR